MPDTGLARRPDVELIRTGSWQLLSGSWNPTRADILAAVEAQNCPAVRRPRIKLGHTDVRFAGDGEPALGWFENMRIADGGHTLVADQVALSWLSSVQAAAYPDRSVEGNYHHKCGLGHTHPFVITAVALLGVTPPGVPTLKSLQDLPDMLGVAASEEVPEGAEHVQVTVLARHRSIDFEESKHPRDHDGQFSHNRGESLHAPTADAPSTTDAPAKVGGLKRDARLASRIPLADGETYTGSATIPGAGIAAARVDGPDGMALRIAFGIDDVDLNRWSGGNKGATAVLDQKGTDRLLSEVAGMLTAGKQGRERYKELDKAATRLEGEERRLVNKQYPNLNAGGRKELAKLDANLQEANSRIDSLDARQQDRIARMTPGVRAQVTEFEQQISEALDKGDTGRASKLREQQIALARASPAGDGSLEGNFGRDGRLRDRLRAETAPQRARREELTAVSVPLPAADQAELDQVRADLNDAYDRTVEFGDGTELAAGVIPGEWGDIHFAASTADDETRYRIAVAPKGSAPDSVFDAGEPLDASDLRKLTKLLEQAGARKTVQASAEAEPEHTGAMVALIPTAEAAARLAVEGGESADQLHVTLAYLGEATELGARGQQDVIDGVSTAANGLPQFDAVAFALNVFNPPGAQRDDGMDRDSCLVLGLSGDPLDAVHDLIDAALREALWSVPTPPQHRPWCAHMTLLYTDDLSRLADLVDRIGPIHFDRIRIAFGGDVIDIPLIAPEDDEIVAASARDDIRARAATIRARLAQKEGVKAGAGEGATPMPSRAELVRAAWNASGAPHQKWVQEARSDAAVVVDDTDAANRTYQLYPVTFDGEQVTFGEPQPYDPAADKALVFASAAESRPEPEPPALAESALTLPAAEPEPQITDPKEDLVSTDLSAFRSRLGLDDTADEQAILSAVDALKTKAETPVEPTPEMVAASAATETENGELRKEVQVLASRMEQVTTELATAKADKAATVKASVFNAAIKDGKIAPAEREQWETDYDEAPAAVTRVLASIAVGTAVPVLASGIAGSPEPTGTDAEFDALIARIDSPTGKVA